MFKKGIFLLLLMNILLLTGCANVSVPLTKENSARIQSIYISQEIKKPEEAYVFASGAEYGMAFGVVGGLISGAMNVKDAATIDHFADDNHVHIQTIVYEQVAQQFAKTRYKMTKTPGNTILQLEIKQYGLSIPHGFSTDYVPVLQVSGKLLMSNQTIWQSAKHVLPLSAGDMPRYKWDEILNDSSKLSKMWGKAAEKIAIEMVDDLNRVR